MVTKTQEDAPLKKSSLPDIARANKGLSLLKLWKSTPVYYKNKARDDNVVIKSLKRKKTKGGLPAITATAVSMATKAPRRVHKCSVIGYDKENPTLSTQKKVLCSCDCFAGKTKVLTDKGWQTIYELAEPFQFGHFPISYNVNGKLVKGSAPFYKGKEPVWRVSLMSGFEPIVATKNQKFLVKTEDGRKVWRKLSNLNVGDKLIANSFQKEYDVDKESNEYKQAMFLGILLGDGHFPDLQLYGHKQELIDMLVDMDLVREVEDYSSRSRSGSRIHFSHRAIEILHRYKYKEKVFINFGNVNQFMGYLSGLINTDGTSYKGGNILIRGGEYLKEFYEYLVALGVSESRLYVERKAGVATNLGVSTKDLYALSIRPKGWAKIANYITLTSYHERRVNQTNGRPKRDREPWVAVTDIVYAGCQHVYDITVPEGNRFTANGVIVHNCESYTFTWEYANWTWGASKIIYSNGEPAVVKNPGNRPGLCIAKDSLVTTRTGEVKIQDIRAGDEVLTLKGYRKVLAAAKTGDRQVVEVQTRSGHAVLTTEEHPFLAFDSKFRWKKAIELEAGDIVFQKKAGNTSKSYSMDPEGVLVGLLIAEADRVDPASTEPKARQIFEQLFYEVLGGGTLARDNSEAQQELSEVRLPLEYLTRLADFRKSLIYGLWLRNGHIAQDLSYASYSTPSKLLARDVQSLLRSCGIYATIWKDDKVYHVRVPNSSIKEFRSCLKTYPTTKGMENLEHAKKKLKEQEAPVGVDNQQVSMLKMVLGKDVTAEVVESVTPKSVMPVYDLEVDRAHHFLANGFVVHNCKHLCKLVATIMENKL